ncbi:XcyI family restriction endonuclease [Xylella taiwanensis]|uniref:XcyI family restriction endonuclease n=1 Tax=Xylella taiwanensis TaxID=1444770 RepID=A0ABS8TU16_9GAMM|nr:XcyI family restriction endonuclease [Xylella taiwanensis]MCD8456277.1 XcyI family restriction endonuclease [Xylella taiwanensis]MCD8458685.1 XcyI family restriction endonuclease [Xylella taiwanensis]MCD8460821.1 XcyI family restriction endonuclease [Xylella taiwanensis]MCD8463122.1 XcyI family restriction endonuclease [Xylella taiwanensis]MCD8465327.1 XcyI family restriction endonuclease [Xylella taiwanensis]
MQSGTHAPNVHTCIGEAEKSYPKARQCRCAECWTVVNVGRLEMAKVRSE